MFGYFFQGVVLALSATIIPGPFQAYLLSQSLRTGWKSTLPAALAPLVTDGPIIALVLVVLSQASQLFLEILRILGGLFLLYLARGIFLALRSEVPIKEPSSAARQSLFHAIVINAINPNPYIFWGVVGGPILLTGWRESMSFGLSFVIGFYATLVCSLAALVIIFGTAGRVNPKFNRLLSILACVTLLFFGLYQAVTGVLAATGG